jgi:tetratricopeptide (TPR) repeat protein
LSDSANKLLTAASGFNGPFHIDLAGASAGLDESAALDAIDEALQAQLLRSTGEHDTYNFTHALIRHTLYGELSPSRQVRLHRQIAEAMERVYGDRAEDHAAELAFQYHRSAAVSGAERGVPHALAAADQAESSAAWDEMVAFLRMALELLPDGDARQPRLLARLGIALMWALQPDEGGRTATEAAALIAAAEGNDAAADYLNDARIAALGAGHTFAGRGLGSEGMRYIGDRRDRVWASLFVSDYMARSATDPDALGGNLPADDPAFETWMAIVRGLNPDERPAALFGSRDATSKDMHAMARPMLQGAAALFVVGDARRAQTIYRDALTSAEREGRIAEQVAFHALIARCLNALGEFAEARAYYERGVALAARLPGPSVHAQFLIAAMGEMRVASGEDLPATVTFVEALLQRDAPELRWLRAVLFAAGAVAFAQAGREDEALAVLARALPAIQRTPLGDDNLTNVICDSAWALWILERTDHVEAIEKSLREKVVAPDFRAPMRDGRTALARLCALQGRYDEASRWFAEARTVLEEDGARPMRAIVDYDEALMYARRNANGDRERALPLLDAAMQQFAEIGMTGWARQAEELRATLTNS